VQLGQVDVTNVIVDNNLLIKPMMDSLPDCVAAEQRMQVESLLLQYVDIFARHEYDVGCTGLVQHKLQLKDASLPPVRETLRRHPIAYLDLIDREVGKLLSAGLVVPCQSEWCSNVVLVQKKPNAPGEKAGTRICLDFRNLNHRLVNSNFPVGETSTVINSLQGAKFFQTLDLANAYLGMQLDPETSDLTAFITRKGQFKFTRLVAGLKPASSAFAHLVSLILGSLQWSEVFAFLDDWTLVSQTFEQGLDLLKRVFERIRISGLKLKPSKCKLFQTKAKILGVIVSDGQVSEDPARANKIRDWRFPRTAKEMRGFIAFANFGRQHYPNFSEKIKPLTDCLKKGAKVECNTETLRAFEEVKAIMTNPPVLTLFDSSARSVVEVDSSAFAMGAVLKNRYEDGSEKVVAYASKCLNPAQTRYCTTRRELLGIIFALKTWRHFLIGRPVIIRTDHAALQYLLKGKTLTNQLARYLDFVADYMIEIEWISGGKNAIADFLSRMSCSDSCKQCHASPARVRYMRSARDGTWLDRQPDMRPTDLSGSVTDVGVAMISTNGDIRSDRPARAEERPLVSLSESCSRALSGATFACSQDAATCDCAAGCSGTREMMLCRLVWRYRTRSARVLRAGTSSQRRVRKTFRGTERGQRRVPRHCAPRYRPRR
jgi:hypothetical protein